MGFVGNYALGGLSPQIYDMPVIPKERRRLPPLLSFVSAGK
jgi:hypothetical protein